MPSAFMTAFGPYWRLSLAFSCLLLGSVSLRADLQLEKQYQETAQKILKRLRDDKIRTTGVLKFSVRIGDGAFPRTLGNLNMRLAEKLEMALVVANPADKRKLDEQVGIVRGASDVADTISGATHLTEEGRRLLFSKAYPLAWKFQGEQETIPDSLIVGVGQVHSDLSKMDLELVLLTRSDLKIQPLASLTVPTDIEDLIDSGESFTTRGLFDSGTIDQKTAVQTLDAKPKEEVAAERVKEQALLVRKETLDKNEPQQAKLHPLAANSTAPITFEIWYDNTQQNIEFREGAAFVQEPTAGQKVIFAVRRKGADKTRYGVLVRVNGENTLYRERTPDIKSTLWILEPDSSAFGIHGFQVDAQIREQFTVLSDEDSEKRTIDYGRDVGMISVVVYQENKSPTPILSDEELDVALQSEARLPEETAESRGDLGKSLFGQLLAQDGTRGLIVEGERKKAAIDTVTFTRDPTPVMATSIRYYQAK